MIQKKELHESTPPARSTLHPRTAVLTPDSSCDLFVVYSLGFQIGGERKIPVAKNAKRNHNVVVEQSVRDY
jgi:hypothetical protein